MRTRAVIAVFFLLGAWNATAQCNINIHLATIPYAKNSSYFPTQYSSELDSVLQKATEKAGYLLLEFQVQQQQESEDIRNYNMWLANRRITRVKEYLTKSNYASPIISRILTAGTERRRDVSISWCESSKDTDTDSNLLTHIGDEHSDIGMK